MSTWPQADDHDETSRPVNHRDAGTYQPSDYSAVTTADLVEILGALDHWPATTQLSAVSGRVRAALDQRNHVERREAFEGRNSRYPYNGASA